MKYINSIFWLIVASGLVISCAKETPGKEDIVTPEKEQTTPDKEVTDLDPSEYLLGFGVAIEDQDTKVLIEESGAMEFEDGDHALVVSGTGCGKYVYSKSDGSFSPVDVSNAIPMASSGISVYYPFKAFELSGSDVIFKMPAFIQSLTDLGDNYPLAAQVVEDNVNGGFKATFKSVCSILQVSITGNRTLETVVLSNTGSKPFASDSEFTVTWSGENPVISSESTGETMTIESNEVLSDTPKVFYFILPAGISFNGVAVTANMKEADAGGLTSFTVTRGNWIPVRNKIFKMDFFAGLFSGGAGTTENPYKIANARDFKHIKTYTTDGYGTLDADHFLAAKYQQTADINFGADADHKSNLTSYMIGTSAAPFTGKYDGQAYGLNNFLISIDSTDAAGLFAYISGATITGVKASNFSVTGVQYVAAIIGFEKNASHISYCITSNGSVQAQNGASGGIIGRTNDNGTEIINCKNGASVTNNNESGVAKNNIGGILGYAAAGVTITDCENSGTIDNQVGRQVGGIIGSCGTGISTVSKCSNSGIIKAKGGYAGGIMGVMGKQTSSKVTMTSVISECSNTGSVIGTAAGAHYNGGIVGIVYGGVISACRNHGHIGSWTINEDGSHSEQNINVQSVGGIIGVLYSGVVNECFGGITPGTDIKAHIRGTGSIGGIIGYIYTNYDQPAIILNCLNRTSADSSGSSEAPVGGIIGYVNAAKQDVSILNCFQWGGSTLLNSNSTNKSAGIGGIVGKVAATMTVEIRNCFSGNNGVSIKQYNTQRRNMDKTYQGYGLIYGRVTGKTVLKDCYYRSIHGDLKGLHEGTYKDDKYKDMEFGVSENQAQNNDDVSANLYKADDALYSVPEGRLHTVLTRGTYSPTDESVKLTATYNGNSYVFSDWNSYSDVLGGYSLQTAIYGLGTNYYNF